MIRLAIVAPSPVIRAGLETLAASSPEIQVVGAFPDFSGAEDLRPDVILASLPPEAGATPTVLLSGDPQPLWTLDALRRGVRALLPRDASPSEILAAVQAAAGDFAVVAAEDLAAWLSASAPREADLPRDATLTPRELEVLRIMADGGANKTIAWKLGVSEHTAKFHVASILAKLGAASRTEAVTIGIRKGLVLL
ncbi:MAG TPA: response regulator transcription factor [Thermodesulfobacteriota bacterium]